MSGFNIFQHPPLSLNLWWYAKNIGVYRSQQQGYGHPLTIIMPQKSEERGKTTWGKSSLKKGQGKNLNNMSSTYIYIHLNELSELLLVKYFDEEIMNSMIMR